MRPPPNLAAIQVGAARAAAKMRGGSRLRARLPGPQEDQRTRPRGRDDEQGDEQGLGGLEQAAQSAHVTAEEALELHARGRPGKLEITPTKPLTTARDLSLAYSPGVAAPCLAIHKDPDAAYDYTARGNLVAVISNGTAVLGLGNLGALGAKPVMEGKAVLFKRFADIDGIDLEVDTQDVDEFVNCVRLLGPTFGGINLEDIKAPECFIIEQRLRELMTHPGVPRRPARHRDHRRRRPDQRARPHRPHARATPGW